MSLKSNLLNELETNRESALSGQALAARFGVSRNAVWKAINLLKEEGYDIRSTPNRGYQLSPVCDRLSQSGIQALLLSPALPLHVLNTVDSTSNYAKRLLANNHTAPFVVVSEAQTAGRGRYGRSFFSPEGGLYLTVALAPRQTLEGLLGITAFAAVCVSEAVRRLTGITPMIKWVNDLYHGGKKVGGILTEAVTDFESGNVDSLLIGIGVNLHPMEVPEEWREIIGFIGGDVPLKNRLAAEITNAVLAYQPDVMDNLTLYRERSLTLGRRVLCTQGDLRFTGVAVALASAGALVVQSDDGTRVTLRSGEATLLPENSPIVQGIAKPDPQ